MNTTQLTDTELLDALATNESIDRDLANEHDDARLLQLRLEASSRGLR